MIWGNTPRSFPAAFSFRGYEVGGTRLLFAPNDLSSCVVVSRGARPGRPVPVHVAGSADARAAFEPEVARLLGVRVGRMLTLGWALAAMAGALAGVLVAPSCSSGPTTSTRS